MLVCRCEAIAAAPGSMMDQQTQYTSSAVQTKDYTGIFPVNYVRPNGSMNLTTARTVVLPQAQVISYSAESPISTVEATISQESACCLLTQPAPCDCVMTVRRIQSLHALQN